MSHLRHMSLYYPLWVIWTWTSGASNTLIEPLLPLVVQVLSHRAAASSHGLSIIRDYFAINPCTNLPLYSDAIVQQYRSKRKDENSLHIFAIAERPWTNMGEERKNQSILIT